MPKCLLLITALKTTEIVVAHQDSGITVTTRFDTSEPLLAAPAPGVAHAAQSAAIYSWARFALGGCPTARRRYDDKIEVYRHPFLGSSLRSMPATLRSRPSVNVALVQMQRAPSRRETSRTPAT